MPVEAHTFNPGTGEAKVGNFCEFKAILIYKLNSKTTGTVNTEKPCFKKQEKKNPGYLSPISDVKFVAFDKLTYMSCFFCKMRATVDLIG